MIKLNLGYVVLPVDGRLVDEVRRWYETQLGLDHVLEDDDRYMLAGKNGFAVEFRKGTPLRNPERGSGLLNRRRRCDLQPHA